MSVKKDLCLFLKEQLEGVKEQIKIRDYSEDNIDEQAILWNLYNKISYLLREI